MDSGFVRTLVLSPAKAAEYLRACEILEGYEKPLDAVAREYVDAMDSIGGARTLAQVVSYLAERMQLEPRTVRDVLEELLMSRGALVSAPP